MPARFAVALCTILFLAMGSGAQAHVFQSAQGPLAGAAHPFSGIDHLLAMFTVGVLSVQLGSRAIWSLPGAFIAGMLVGGLVAFQQVPLPFLEVSISLTVVALGLLLAFPGRLTFLLSHPLVIGFGIYHGFAHGAEIPNHISPLPYFAGFLVSTAGLHLMGVFSGLLTRDKENGHFQMRLFGGVVFLTGLVLVLR